MNRTDRLYAVVEELRASAPRRRGARELAERFEVSVRTIERDISALQQAGVPIYAEPGGRGGYTLDKTMTLPPLNLTPAEAVAVAITLDQADGSPYGRSTRSALHKIMSAMAAADHDAARDLEQRIRVLVPLTSATPEGVPAVIEAAVGSRQVVRLAYVDRNGTTTERDVEPVAFVTGARGWHFIGWCRLREAARAFRLDRITRASLLDELAPPRQYDEEPGPAIPDLVAHALELD